MTANRLNCASDTSAPSSAPAAAPSGLSQIKLFATLSGLYLAQGIPTYLIAAALPPVLREHGVSRSSIGLLSLLMLPLVLKFLWAPLIDRFRFLPIGHRRGWIVPMQLVTATAIACMALIEPTNVVGLFAICTVLAIAMSTQDIATDGYATRTLSEQNRGVGNACQGGAVAFGVVIGGTGSLVLFETVGWTATLLTVAAISLLPLLVTLWMREPEQQPPQVASPCGGRALPNRPSLRAFFMRREAVRILIVALVFRASEGLVKAMEGPYLVDAGLPLSWIGYLSGASAATAGIIGSILAIALIKWQGTEKALLTLGALRTVCFALFALHAIGWVDGYLPVMSAAGFQTFIRYMEIVVLYSLFMSVASKNQPGTDFTILACAQLIVYLLGSSLSGLIADAAGYDLLFVIATALSALAVLLTARVFTMSIGQPGNPEMPEALQSATKTQRGNHDRGL
ncbi:MFS transporter [Pseudovibrio exalbescens]|uniref:MFS transporter n=1 Tax=Pseudovibrio exalbescens TaxID=197461 RepID=UPI00236603C1|nr:MFS transporter [Pseudovibrio exalbescens]MDD7912002.1 MFS transporter [Pseudovibrio exalbescens]